MHDVFEIGDGDEWYCHLRDSIENGELAVEIEEELTEQEIAAIDLQLGEQFADGAIALARRLHKTPEKQAKELRWWYELAKAFPCHAPYSRPLLAAEINRLEEQG